MSSPPLGTSILMTFAPMSASIMVQKGPASTRVRSRTVRFSNAICSLMLQLSILNVDLHAHHGTAHGFAQAVQTQAHGGTAAQSVLHNKVEAVQTGHVVAGDLALDHVAKVGFEFFGGHLALNDLIVFRFACIHTDIAGIALVTGAAVSNIVQIDLCHLTSPLVIIGYLISSVPSRFSLCISTAVI